MSWIGSSMPRHAQRPAGVGELAQAHQQRGDMTAAVGIGASACSRACTAPACWRTSGRQRSTIGAVGHRLDAADVQQAARLGRRQEPRRPVAELLGEGLSNRDACSFRDVLTVGEQLTRPNWKAKLFGAATTERNTGSDVDSAPASARQEAVGIVDTAAVVNDLAPSSSGTIEAPARMSDDTGPAPRGCRASGGSGP